MVPTADASGVVLTWVVRALYTGSAVAYMAHVWLVWRRVREARALFMGFPRGPAPRRERVTVRTEILLHHGEAFLLRDVMPAPQD